MARERPLITLVEAEEVIPTKLKKEPTGARPVIPTGNTCCIGVCTTINSEVDDMSQALKIRQDELKITAYGTGRIKMRRQITALTNRISVLKDLRFTLKEKNVCKCIETK